MHPLSSRVMRRWLVVVCAFFYAQTFAAPVALPNFNVDIEQTSVSGLSSGGFMAVQFSVAYSAIIMGAGIIAGGPYYCAQGDIDIAIRKCSCTGNPFFVLQGGAGVYQCAATDRYHRSERTRRHDRCHDKPCASARMAFFGRT